jgi:hypothetical protein
MHNRASTHPVMWGTASSCPVSLQAVCIQKKDIRGWELHWLNKGCYMCGVMSWWDMSITSERPWPGTYTGSKDCRRSKCSAGKADR